MTCDLVSLLLFFPHLLQPTENEQLKFDSHILLHDMVSQVNTSGCHL